MTNPTEMLADLAKLMAAGISPEKVLKAAYEQGRFDGMMQMAKAGIEKKEERIAA